MGDDALLLAPDDGDMDFGDINCDLLDADGDDVSGTVNSAINQEGSKDVSSKGDDLRQKMELKKGRRALMSKIPDIELQICIYFFICTFLRLLF